MEHAAYETHELSRALQAIRDREQATLADRREARVDYAEALRLPGLVAERIGWLLGGSYGYGEMRLAERIAGNPRCNRVAGLSLLVASCEWQCPGRFAAEEWHRLTQDEQVLLTVSITAELEEWDATRHTEEGPA